MCKLLYLLNFRDSGKYDSSWLDKINQHLCKHHIFSHKAFGTTRHSHFISHVNMLRIFKNGVQIIFITRKIYMYVTWIIVLEVTCVLAALELCTR
jgi:hypothetical protein